MRMRDARIVAIPPVPAAAVDVQIRKLVRQHTHSMLIHAREEDDLEFRIGVAITELLVVAE